MAVGNATRGKFRIWGNRRFLRVLGVRYEVYMTLHACSDQVAEMAFVITRKFRVPFN